MLLRLDAGMYGRECLEDACRHVLKVEVERLPANLSAGVARRRFPGSFSWPHAHVALATVGGLLAFGLTVGIIAAVLEM